MATARALLAQESRRVQAPGYDFNTEYDYPLTPNGDGEIVMASNCASVDIIESLYSKRVILRGTRLYDQTNRTYVFTETNLLATVVFLLDFDELPESARHYITVLAARAFVRASLGEDVSAAYTERDERRARVEFRRQEARQADRNGFNNYTVARSIRRDGTYYS